MENDIHEIDQKLWDLVRWLTSHDIPYHPPLSGWPLENMRINNPRAYAKLEEYQRLDAIYKRLTEESI